MDALSNVNLSEPSLSSGLNPSAIPDAKNEQTGVSVRYVPEPDHKWFVLRASYGRELMVEEALIASGIYAYVPKHYVYREVNGKPKKVLEKLISNLVFVYLTPHDAEVLVRNNDPQETSSCPQLASILSFYYNHFTEIDGGYNPPLTISCAEMENFIRLTATQDENIMMLQEGDFRYKSDDEVVVTAGQFKDIRGRVIRAHGQQRVLVSLTGLCLCATAYIPSAFLQKVDS